MSCNPETSEKLEKLLDFLGIDLCWNCKGKKRIKHTICSCCEPEVISCPECKGEGFLVHEYSLLKNFLATDEDDEIEGIGLCD